MPIYDDLKPLNAPSSPLLQDTTHLPDIPSFTPEPKDTGLDFNKFLNAPASDNAAYQPETFDWKAENADRYVNSPYMKELGFNPGADNEEKYGQRQTWGNTMSNAFVGGGKLAWNGMIDGWKGWGRMTDAVTSWDWEKLRGDGDSLLKLNGDKPNDDGFSFTGGMGQIMDENAIYATKDSDATFFNRKTLGNLFQQTGFTVGTIGQTLLEQGLTKLVEGALFIPTLGAGSAALEVAEDTKSAAQLAEMAEKMSQAKKLFNVSKFFKESKSAADVWKEENTMVNMVKMIGSKIPGADIGMDLLKASNEGASVAQLGYIGLSGIKRLASEANLSMTEARMEAAGTYSQMINKMTSDYTQSNGSLPTGDDLDKIRNTASAAATDNFNFNSALLSVMNKIQFDNVFRGFKATSKMGRIFGFGAEEEGGNLLKVEGVLKDATDGKITPQYYRKGLLGTASVVGKIATDYGGKKAAAELGWSVLKSGAKWEIGEGIQELLQNGSNDYFADYYNQRYNGQNNPDRQQSFGIAVDKEWSMEGLKTFMSGALMGLVTEGPMHILEHSMQHAAKGDREKNHAYNEAVDKHLSELNPVMRDIGDVFPEIIKNFKIQDAVSKEINQTILNKDQLSFEDLKSTALHQLVVTAVRNKTSEGLIDTLKEYGKHFSKEDFEKAFVGTEYNSDNKKSAHDYTNKIVNAIENYSKDWEKFQDKYGSRHNPDIYIPNSVQQNEAKFARQTTDDMIEILASNRFKAKDTLQRMISIFEGISSTPNTGASLAHSFTVMGSEDHTKGELYFLSQEIRGMQATPKGDAANTQLLKLKQQQYNALKDWQSAKADPEHKDSKALSEESFKSYVNSKNTEANVKATVTDDEMQRHMKYLDNYLELTKRSHDFTDAFNMLIDPKNFPVLLSKLMHGAKMAAVHIQLMAIGNAERTIGFSIKHKDLIAEFAELMKKPLDSKEANEKYYDLVDQMHEAAKAFTPEDVKEYLDQVITIIKENETFFMENKTLYEEITALNDQLAEPSISDLDKEKVTEELEAKNKERFAKAYEYLVDHPEAGEPIKEFVPGAPEAVVEKPAVPVVEAPVAAVSVAAAPAKFESKIVAPTIKSMTSGALNKMPLMAVQNFLKNLIKNQADRDKAAATGGEKNEQRKLREEDIANIKAYIEARIAEEKNSMVNPVPAPVAAPVASPIIVAPVIAAAPVVNTVVTSVFTAANMPDAPTLKSITAPSIKGKTFIYIQNFLNGMIKNQASKDEAQKNGKEKNSQRDIREEDIEKIRAYMELLYPGAAAAQVAAQTGTLSGTPAPAPAAPQAPALGALTTPHQTKINELDLTLGSVDFTKAVTGLIKSFNGIIEALHALREKVGKYRGEVSVKEFLLKIIDGTQKVSPYVPLSTVIRNETFNMVDGAIITSVYKENGVVKDLYTGEEVVVPATATGLDKKDTKVLDIDGMKLTENIDTERMHSGITMLQSKEISRLLSSNVNIPFIVTGTKVMIENAAKKLALIKSAIPGRTEITHENKAQRLKLSKGESILTIRTQSDGFSVNIGVPGNKARAAVFFMDSYVKVNADNTTERIDFSEGQRVFLLENMLVAGKKVTDSQLDQMKRIYDHSQKFKQEAEALFLNDKEADVTTVFNKYYTISTTGVQLAEESHAPFSDVVSNKQNSNDLMHATIGEFDSSGELVPGSERSFSFPVIQTKLKNEWEFVDPLEKTTIKPTDEDNKIALVLNGKRASVAELLSAQGIVVPTFDSSSRHRFLPMSSLKEDKTFSQRIDLIQSRGAEPVEGFLNLVTGLMEQIQQATTSSNVNKQMKAFAMQSFTFAAYKQWGADFSLYTPKGKATQINIQLTPTTMQGKSFIEQSKIIKKQLNIFINSKALDKIKALVAKHGTAEILASPELTAQVKSLYNKITQDISEKMNELQSKIKTAASAEDYAELEKFGVPDSHLLVEYKDDVHGNRTWELKAIDKNKNKALADNYKVMWDDSAVSNQRNLQIVTADALSTSVVESTINEPESPEKSGNPLTTESAAETTEQLTKGKVETTEATEPQQTAVAATPEALAAVGASESAASTIAKPVRRINSKPKPQQGDFSLQQDGEDFVPYTDETFKQETTWLDANLPESLRRGALEDVINNLSAGKKILGYFSDRVMYFSRELSSQGTGYHEAFHGVFKELMNQSQRNFYTSKALIEIGHVSDEMLERYAQYRNLNNKTRTELLTSLAEEHLADGFKAFKLRGSEPAQGWFKQFVKMLGRIVDFFTGNHNAIKNLYSDISEGKYKNAALTTERNEEGAFQLGYGRPTMVINEHTNEIDAIDTSMNATYQQELINRLTHEVSKNPGKFDDEFETARLKLIEEYDTKQLLKGIKPEFHNAAIKNYQNKFWEYQFALGKETPYVLSNEVSESGQEMPWTTADLSEATVALLKKEVKAKMESLGIEDGWFESMDKKLLDDEEEEIEKHNGAYDKVNINPLIGMPKQLRNYFSLFPYIEVDPESGVKHTRMLDGGAMFDAIIKIASNNIPGNIFSAFALSVDMMKGGDKNNYLKMNTMLIELMKQFGMEKDDYTPRRNLHLYQQFVDTFFVNELPTYQIIVTTEGSSSTALVKDASLQEDVQKAIDKLKLAHEMKFQKLSKEEQKEKYSQLQNVLSGYFNRERLGEMNVMVGDYTELQKISKEIKAAFNEIGIELPQYLVTNSLIGIYFEEDKKPVTAKMLSSNSKAAAIYRAYPQLFKEGSYLQKDFFHQYRTGGIVPGDNIFEKTKFKKGATKSGVKGSTPINMVTGILKKAAIMLVKFDINTSVSVFKNSEGENQYRYTRYTPPGLITELIRTKGMEGLLASFPELTDWFKDSPLMEETPENKLFLNNFRIALFGGARQKLNEHEQEGVTFGHIDPATLYLSSLILFMERKTISQGNVSIKTFNRSRSQEEGMSTNYLVTGLYKRMIGLDGNMNSEVIDSMTKVVRQEYNRIQKEWSEKDIDKKRYIDFNDFNTPGSQQRALDFRVLEHFFKNEQVLAQSLIANAKSGLSFEEAMKAEMASGTVKDNLETQATAYIQKEIENYKDLLRNHNVISKKDASGKSTASELVPARLKIDNSTESMQDEGYTLDSMLTDHWLNIFNNKLIVNQIFDGDVAITVKDATQQYKRNKSMGISGNSLKEGFHNTATISEVNVLINNAHYEHGQYDNYEDIPAKYRVNADGTEMTDEELKAAWKPSKVMDGQSYHTMNHRITMMQKIGRNHPDVMDIMRKGRYMELTEKEVKMMEKLKVVLNSMKTATGGVITFNKLSEHLLLRTDISTLNISHESQREQAEKELKTLFDQIDMLEGRFMENSRPPDDAEDIKTQLKKLYTSVQSYWTPIRTRAPLHFMLNSMELSHIDQLFDTNSSKKGTYESVDLNREEATDLEDSRMETLNIMKFMQVETSGVHPMITDPTQARQLITTYLMEDHMGKDLNQLAKEYSSTLGEIAKSATDKVNRLLLNKDGKININNLYLSMHKDLQSQNADSNTLKMLELVSERDEKGEKTGNLIPLHNLNIPSIKKLFTYYYFAFYSRNIFSSKVAGRHDILVSSYGYKVLVDANDKIITTEEQKKDPKKYADESLYKTRHLGVESTTDEHGVTTHVVEIMIPMPYFATPEHKELWLAKQNVFFLTRIPTEDKRSMIVGKVVDFLDSAYSNSIVVPQFIHLLAGSDLDVDSLYSHIYASYDDLNGRPHIYGDYETYQKYYGSTKSAAQFAEYVNHMVKDPSVQDIIQREKDKVELNPEIPAELENIRKELNLPYRSETKEQFQKEILNLKNLKSELEGYRAHYKAIGDIGEENFKDQAPQRQQEIKDAHGYVRDMSDQKEDVSYAIQNHIDNIKRIETLITLIATINILKEKGLPVTEAALTAYNKDKKTTNLVIPILQNATLATKIKILSHDKIFKELYIRETSEHGVVEAVATSIGARVKDVMSANSTLSVQGDVVANQVNTSSSDGIGIAASFVKYLSFAVKEKLATKDTYFHILGKDGKVKGLKTFQDKTLSTIREVGRLLGVFTDATKNPIPAVLNLNTVTTSVSLTMVGLGVSLQSSLLINKIPVIEAITDKVILAQGAVQTASSIYEKSRFESIAREVLDDFKKELAATNRLGELYKLDEKGRIVFNPMTLEPVLKKLMIEETTPNAEFTTKEHKTAQDLGFIIKDMFGKESADDIAQHFLLIKWLAVNALNTDVRKVSSVLNLIKKLDPAFSSMDKILDDHGFLMSGQSKFENIEDILDKSEEYKPLVAALREMDKHSREIVIERNLIIKSIDTIIKTGLNTYTLNSPESRDKLTDSIIKYIIVNKFKQENAVELEKLIASGTADNTAKMQNLENAAQFFKADYWINNDFKADLHYLLEAYKGNAFVEFLKVEGRDNIDVTESISRMKLDKDLAESIINGFQALENGPDIKAKLIANKLFFHTLVKDGLGYSNNSFVKYINPNMKQYVKISHFLNEFQELLKKSTKQLDALLKTNHTDNKKKELIREQISSVFSGFFTDKNQHLDGFIDNIMTHIGTYVGNKDFRVAGKVFNGKKLAGEDLTKEQVTEVYKLLVTLFPETHKEIVDKHNKKSDVGNVTVTTDKTKTDFFTPSSFVMDEGKVVVDTENLKTEEDIELAGTILKQVGIYNISEGVYGFPLYVTNKFDQLLELVQLDDKSVSETIKNNVIEYLLRPGMNTNDMAGKKALYILTENTGTRNIMNIGFNQSDGRKLYEHTQEIQKAGESDMTPDQKIDSQSDDWNNDHSSSFSSYEELEPDYGAQFGNSAIRTAPVKKAGTKAVVKIITTPGAAKVVSTATSPVFTAFTGNLKGMTEPALNNFLKNAIKKQADADYAEQHHGLKNEQRTNRQNDIEKIKKYIAAMTSSVKDTAEATLKTTSTTGSSETPTTITSYRSTAPNPKFTYVTANVKGMTVVALNNFLSGLIKKEANPNEDIKANIKALRSDIALVKQYIADIPSPTDKEVKDKTDGCNS